LQRHFVRQVPRGSEPAGRNAAAIVSSSCRSRLSAWILCGLPIFVAVAVTFMNPDYMAVLWKDQRGHYLIAAAISMQITGMLIVKKILNIKI